MRSRLFIRMAAFALLLPCVLSCGGRSASTPVQPVPASAEVLQTLPGNYSMKITSAGEIHYSTAVVRSVAAGTYQIARITVYGPVLYGFTVKADASVVSEELGKGQVTWQENIKKLCIRFEREDFVCELSR